MHEQITNLLWAWHGFCNCGISGKVYKKNGCVLYHYYEKKTWRLKQGRREVDTGTDDNLIEQIKNI